MSIFGIFGGSKKPQKEDYLKEFRPYWQSYSGWMSSAQQNYQDLMSSTQAGFAVMGMGEENPTYQNRMAAIEQEYKSEIEDIQSGETYKSLAGLYEQYHVSDRFEKEAMKAGAYPMPDTSGMDATDVMIAQTQQRAKVSQDVRNYIKSGELPAYMEGKKLKSMEEWYTKQYGPTATQMTEEQQQEQREYNARMVAAGQNVRRPGDEEENRSAQPWW